MHHLRLNHAGPRRQAAADDQAANLFVHLSYPVTTPPSPRQRLGGGPQGSPATSSEDSPCGGTRQPTRLGTGMVQFYGIPIDITRAAAPGWFVPWPEPQV